jgi:hypothetical protein
VRRCEMMDLNVQVVKYLRFIVPSYSCHSTLASLVAHFESPTLPTRPCYAQPCIRTANDIIFNSVICRANPVHDMEMCQLCVRGRSSRGRWLDEAERERKGLQVTAFPRAWLVLCEHAHRTKYCAMRCGKDLTLAWQSTRNSS